MKRDVEYMIELLQEFEKDEDYVLVFPKLYNIDEKLHHHLQLLCDEGYVKQESKDCYRITARGHDFLDNIGKGRLEKIKEKMKDDFGNTPLEIISTIGYNILKSKLVKNKQS